MLLSTLKIYIWICTCFIFFENTILLLECVLNILGFVLGDLFSSNEEYSVECEKPFISKLHRSKAQSKKTFRFRRSRIEQVCKSKKKKKSKKPLVDFEEIDYKTLRFWISEKLKNPIFWRSKKVCFLASIKKLLKCFIFDMWHVVFKQN